LIIGAIPGATGGVIGALHRKNRLKRAWLPPRSPLPSWLCLLSRRSLRLDSRLISDVGY
jgi:hypothetical protein